MKLLSGFAIVAAALFCQSVLADLPTRSEQLDRRFEEERAQGLIALNERYIEDFRKELGAVMQAGNLEVANEIKAEIQKLGNEISDLREKLANPELMGESVVDDESLVVGKTVMFPHNTSPDKMVGLRFLENGEAVWIGLGAHEVERAFRKMEEPRKFFVWWPARGDLSGYEVTVSEDGKEAHIYSTAGNHNEVGKLERSR